MKRQTLLLPFLGSLLLLYFPSCINKDYDWDNLNKDATFPIGNIPLGNVSPIRIDSILEDRGSTEFQYDAAGNIYLEYSGEIDINIPQFSLKPVGDKQTKPVQRPIEAGTYFPAALPIETNSTLAYDIPEPDQDKNDEWEIEIQSIHFEESNLFIDVYLDGVPFPEDEYQLNITMDFPLAIEFADHDNNRDIKNNVLTFSLDPALITSSEEKMYTYGPIHIAAFDYQNEEDITYSAGLISGGNGFPMDETTMLTFRMTIRTIDLKPSFIYGNADFMQLVDGEVDEIGSLGDVLGEEASFTIDNPSMTFELGTNVGFNFNVFIDKLEATGENGTTGTLTHVTGTDGKDMFFVAPEKGDQRETSYYIAQENDQRVENFIKSNLNVLTEVKPEKLTYDITAQTAGTGMQSGFFPYNAPFIEAEYTFHIPFSFESIVMSFEEILEDAFSDDIAEKLFTNAGEFKIVADDVKVQLGGPAAAKENATLTITAVVYDYDNNRIDIRVDPAVLQNGEGTLEIVMHIGENDTEKMQNAKHLGFDFSIAGTNLTMNKSDYIEINKLKFKTTGGISFEF